MSEAKQLSKESALALIKETKESVERYEAEARNSSVELQNLKERKEILQLALTKTKSGMAQTIIDNMIGELQKEIEAHEKHIRLCENNRKYYLEITKALEEAINEY